MAYVDLVLNVDDELGARLQAQAQKAGVSLERWLDNLLAENVGHTYDPPDESERFEPRPVVLVDLVT